MEIVPGVHLVSGVRGANCYLVVSGDSIIVIDTGLPGNAKRILGYIESLDKRPQDAKYILLTHADIDHIGSAAELKALTGAQVAIHAGDAAMLAGEEKPKQVKGALAPLFRAMARLLRFRPLRADLFLSEGYEVGGLKVVATPGHTRGSISLYRPGDLLFSGDALRSNRLGNPRLPWKAATLDLNQAWESVKKIAGLDFNILLAGHGKPVLREASLAVRRLVARAE